MVAVILILSHAAAFGLGALVFRNNEKKANQVISSVQSAASTVAGDVKAAETAVKKA